MANTTATPVMNIRYIVLENDIPYDWDDYDAWGVVAYDLIDKKVVTSTYGHGSGCSINDTSTAGGSIKLADAIDAGIVTVDEILKGIINVFPLRISQALETIACSASLENPVAIPVNVTGGRKFKGNGYIVYAISERENYGWGAYHNQYNHYPVVVNTENGTFNKINSFSYANFNIDETEVRENIFNNVEHTIATIEYLAHWWAYNMSYSACDSDNARNLSRKVTARGLDFTNIPEVVTKAIENENARIAAEAEAKMNAELPKIIEWVKTNTDKTTEEDILELAKHIYYKHNK